jgi:hypothetical protein
MDLVAMGNAPLYGDFISWTGKNGKDGIFRIPRVFKMFLALEKGCTFS